MGSVSNLRSIALSFTALSFVLVASACSGELGYDSSLYTQCPPGWQPNSTGDACAPICSDGTLLNSNETGCVPNEVVEVEAPGDDQDASDARGSTSNEGNANPYIDCPTGWQPNSTGEGCAPVCADGTELNADEDGCVPIPDETTPSSPNDEDAGAQPGDPSDTATGPIEEPQPGDLNCPSGYQEAEIDGVKVCIPASNITVHGYILDAASGQGIAGASISANALSDDTLVSDDSGYFEISGVTQVGSIAVFYSADGYHSSYAWVSIQSASSYGASEVFIDATASLVAIDEESVETPVATDGWVSGSVYAGDQPAANATVRLRYESTGAEAGVALTDASGAFLITDVAASGHTFELLVDNFDADADGSYDYQGQTIDIGAINEGGNSSVNASNLVIVLEAIGKSLSYVNFTPPLTDISGAGLYTGLQFGLPGANLIFHFGAEVQKETLIVSLVERIDGVISKYVDVSVSWNDAGTVLTLNPAGLLTQDADPSTDYELRIESLLWSDGSAFVPLDAGVTGAARFQFQVGEVPSYLPNPIPTIYTDNLGTDAQEVVLISCDARVCWLLDSAGYPIDGFVFPGEEPNPSGFIANDDGFQLTWAPVAGATNYKIYARQTYDGPEATALQGWVELDISSLVTGEFAAGTPTTVYATGILSTGSPTWLDFGAGGEPQVGNTLAFGNIIQLAITVVDELGVESPIDENKTLSLLDLTPVGLRGVSESAPDNSLEPSGVYDALTSFELLFSELVDPSVTPTWSLLSNRFHAMTQPSETTWGDGDALSGFNVGDEGVSHELQFDMKWPCAVIKEDVESGATKLVVNDVQLFPSGDTTEVLFLSGSNSANLAHTNLRKVFENNPATGEIEFFNPLDNGLQKGDFVCKALKAAGLSGEGGTMFVDESQPGSDITDVELFHVGQSVLVTSSENVGGDAKQALVYETVVTGMRVPLINPSTGLVVSLGRLHLAHNPPMNYSNSVIFAKPTKNVSFRKVSEMSLAEDMSATPADAPVNVLHVSANSFENSYAMVGDLVIIDVDGNLDTVGDQHRAIIESLNILKDNPETGDVDETDYDVTLAPLGNNATALPSTFEFNAATTRILFMGDSFTLSGLKDTSGNIGLHDKRDQFSFCDGAFPECSSSHANYIY